jgi:pimeloyl-ACP methyl ester carboxylesterase
MTMADEDRPAGAYRSHPDGVLTLISGSESRWVDLDGPLHYLDFGGPEGAPLMVCVHGLGGSAVNWSAFAPLLTDSYRVLAPDLAGHGLTQSHGRDTSVAANRMLLHRFVEAMANEPVVLVGNSMGGMISLLEATAAAQAVSSLVLIDPALPFVPARPHPLATALLALFATPGLGRVMVTGRDRLPPEALVASTMSLCCADVSRIPADVRASHVAVARERAAFSGTDRDFAAAMRSVIVTASYFGGRHYRQGLRSIRCPVLLIHGDRDRLVPVGAARATARANPSWALIVLPGVGHAPQLEAPVDTAAVILRWLGPGGRAAAGSAAAIADSA